MLVFHPSDLIRRRLPATAHHCIALRQLLKILFFIYFFLSFVFKNKIGQAEQGRRVAIISTRSTLHDRRWNRSFGCCCSLLSDNKKKTWIMQSEIDASTIERQQLLAILRLGSVRPRLIIRSHGSISVPYCRVSLCHHRSWSIRYTTFKITKWTQYTKQHRIKKVLGTRLDSSLTVS